jgi:hypothetical protein
MFCGKKLCLLYFYHAKDVFKSSRHPFVTCVVNCPSNFTDEILPHSLRNVMSFILRIKWVTMIKVKTLIFVM